MLLGFPKESYSANDMRVSKSLFVPLEYFMLLGLNKNPVWAPVPGSLV